MTTATDRTYNIDWLTIEVKVTHDKEVVNNGVSIRIPKLKNGDGYDFNLNTKSYIKARIANSNHSYSNELDVKSINDNELKISGNFYKWLNGENIKGTDNITKLVGDVIIRLSELMPAITPTQKELQAINDGEFKIHRIDINMPILFDTQQQAINYLGQLKHHASYPYLKKDVENNGVYFGKDSKRKTILYYHKGNEIVTNKKYQHNLDNDLIELANRMIRCELRLFWRDLYDNNLLNGYNWSSSTVKQLIENTHDRLRLPEVLDIQHLPIKYQKFISCFKGGLEFNCYSESTIERMKKDLIRSYGLYLDDIVY